MENELAIIVESDLSLVDDNNLNKNQLSLLLRKTPPQFIKKRPAKGGGTWDYVSGGYVKKCLNLMFGWDWSFEIIDEKILYGEAIVKGKLTCRSNGREIIKMQFGNKDIVFKKQTDAEVSKGLERIPLSIGNDLKSAATDCLKKCAAEIGIAADIYNKEEFKEAMVVSDDEVNDIHSELTNLFEAKKESIPTTEYANIKRILNNKEVKSYTKLSKFLKSL